MARLSRTHFPVYEDTKDANAGLPPNNWTSAPPGDLETRPEAEEEEASSKIASIHAEKRTDRGHDANNNESNLRRESTITDASISSMPESLYPTDSECGVPMHEPYEFPSGRPIVRRPEPFYRCTPRPRIQSRLRSRTGTPTKGARSRASDDTQSTNQKEDAVNQYPLVLLHIDLLPIKWRWSEDTIQDILPLQARRDLQLLQHRVDCTIQKRGILIRHPGCEYDLLEERFFEALGLHSERITADGHFVRPRIWTEEDIPELSCPEESDSGLGSSVDGSDTEPCSTCQHHCKENGARVTAGGKKWSFKAFAANGLLTASTWAACWEEMERVDIEILPWVSEELKQKLDQREEEESSHRRAEEESERVRLLVQEHVQLALKEAAEHVKLEHLKLEEQPAAAASAVDVVETPTSKEVILDHDLPPIYSRSQIPLSVLLRNYLYILAQDRRNVVILALLVTLMLTGLHRQTSDYDQMSKPSHILEQDSQILCAEARPSPDTFSVRFDDPTSLSSASDASRIYEAKASPLTIHLAAESVHNGLTDRQEEDRNAMANSQAVAWPSTDEGLGMCNVPAFAFEEANALSWPSCRVGDIESQSVSPQALLASAIGND